jgi:hypothetical protein
MTKAELQDALQKQRQVYRGEKDSNTLAALWRVADLVVRLDEPPKLRWKTGPGPHGEQVLYRDTHCHYGTCRYLANPDARWILLADLIPHILPPEEPTPDAWESYKTFVNSRSKP